MTELSMYNAKTLSSLSAQYAAACACLLFDDKDEVEVNEIAKSSFANPGEAISNPLSREEWVAYLIQHSKDAIALLERERYRVSSG